MKKVCKDCKKEFLIIDSEISFLKKKDLPLPVNCPKCRQDRRMALRSKRELHKRKCDKCGKDIVTTYSADSKYTVYCPECYWDEMG